MDETKRGMFKMTRKCYRAVIKEQWKKAAKEFTKEEEEVRPKLQFPVTSNNDLALHLAVHSGKEEPTRELLLLLVRNLGMNEEEDIERDFWKNNEGNTPLHEAATVGNLAAVKLLVEFKKDDMLVKNIYGETPLYRAAEHGQLHIVEYFLDNCEDLYTRSPLNWIAGDVDTPIIHAAIQSENLEVAWKLIDFDESLLAMKNSRGETALHVLANMPHIFESGFSMSMPLFGRLLYRLLPNEKIYKYKFCNFGAFDDNDKSSTTEDRKNEDIEAGSYPQCCKSGKKICARIVWPKLEELYAKKQNHNSAKALVSKLTTVDDSWFQATTNFDNSQIQIYSDEAKKILDVCDYKNIIYKDHHETPLLLATAKGIIEVVKTIVKTDPQAVDCVTSQNRNILHLAILHRQKEIFNWLLDQKLVMDRLGKRIDVMGFTVLHQVGIIQYVPIHQHGPALQLQRELVWFDSVQLTIPPRYATHQNKARWEASEFFDETHKEMLDTSKAWLKNTSESCSAVAVLIATVVFAAAFSVPGGLNGKTGSPVLLAQPLYMLFTIMDIVGLTTSLCSVVLFLSILTSSFKMDDFRRILPMKLSLGFQFLFFSIVCTMMAFTLAIVLTVKSEEMKWAVSFLYLATFLPVSAFIIIQLPLYMELIKSICVYRPFFLDLLPMGLVPDFLFKSIVQNFVAKEINLIFIGGLGVGFGRIPSMIDDELNVSSYVLNYLPF